MLEVLADPLGLALHDTTEVSGESVVACGDPPEVLGATCSGRPPRRCARSPQGLRPGAHVATLARRHAMSASQLYAWCREARVAGDESSRNRLVPVVVDDTPGSRHERSGAAHIVRRS